MNDLRYEGLAVRRIYVTKDLRYEGLAVRKLLVVCSCRPRVLGPV